VQGNHSIHRDGFSVGPEVDLCDACGGRPEPTCEEIWDRIAETPAPEPPAQCWGELAVGNGQTLVCALPRHTRGDHQAADGTRWLARRRRGAY
jgi:hypothetical protein